MVLAVGEIPYHSRVTDRQEKLPFAVAVMGNSGKLSCKPSKVEERSRLITVFRDESSSHGYIARHPYIRKSTNQSRIWQEHPLSKIVT